MQILRRVQQEILHTTFSGINLYIIRTGSITEHRRVSALGDQLVEVLVDLHHRDVEVVCCWLDLHP